MSGPGVPMEFDRRVVEVVRESSYGIDPGTRGVFPAFDQDGGTPRWNANRPDKTPAGRAFGASRPRLTDLSGEIAPLRTFLMPGDDAWLMLLEASGFVQRSDVTWEAIQSPRHTSLTVRHHQGRMRKILTGVRGSLQLRATAGGPIALDANLSGSMREEVGQMPSGARTSRALAQFCDAQLRCDVEGVGAFVPKGLNEVAIDSGTVLVSKVMAGGRMVWRVENVVPEIRCVVEQSPECWWVSLPDAKASVSIVLAGWRWEFPVTALAERPVDLRLPSGLAGVSLVFRTVAESVRPVRVVRV